MVILYLQDVPTTQTDADTKTGVMTLADVDKEVIAMDWEIASDVQFEDVVLQSIEDHDNLKSIMWDTVLDPTRKWYARARALIKDKGYTKLSNIQVIIPDMDLALTNTQDIPSKVSIPILKTSSDPKNHDLSNFTLSLENIATLGNSTHSATSYILEKLTGEVVWSDVYDILNKTSITIRDIVLDPNTVYRFRAMVHTTSNDTSQLSTITVITTPESKINIISDLTTIAYDKENEIEIAINEDYKELEWSLISLVNNYYDPVWTKKTKGSTLTTCTIPRNIMINGEIYMLTIKPVNHKDTSTFYQYLTLLKTIKEDTGGTSPEGGGTTGPKPETSEPTVHDDFGVNIDLNKNDQYFGTLIRNSTCVDCNNGLQIPLDRNFDIIKFIPTVPNKVYSGQIQKDWFTRGGTRSYVMCSKCYKLYARNHGDDQDILYVYQAEQSIQNDPIYFEVKIDGKNLTSREHTIYDFYGDLNKGKLTIAYSNTLSLNSNYYNIIGTDTTTRLEVVDPYNDKKKNYPIYNVTHYTTNGLEYMFDRQGTYYSLIEYKYPTSNYDKTDNALAVPSSDWVWKKDIKVLSNKDLYTITHQYTFRNNKRINYEQIKTMDPPVDPANLKMPTAYPIPFLSTLEFGRYTNARIEYDLNEDKSVTVNVYKPDTANDDTGARLETKKIDNWINLYKDKNYVTSVDAYENYKEIILKLNDLDPRTRIIGAEVGSDYKTEGSEKIVQLQYIDLADLRSVLPRNTNLENEAYNAFVEYALVSLNRPIKATCSSYYLFRIITTTEPKPTT